jgi:hypothetical protein
MAVQDPKVLWPEWLRSLFKLLLVDLYVVTVYLLRFYALGQLKLTVPSNAYLFDDVSCIKVIARLIDNTNVLSILYKSS